MPMTAVYAGEHVRKRDLRASIYIEGRSEEWVRAALEFLEAKRFLGVVYLPRTREGEWADDDEVLYDQKTELLAQARVIAFWISEADFAEPASSITMLHFGAFARSRGAVLGIPNGWKYAHVFERRSSVRSVPVFFSMQEVLGEALKLATHY